MQWDRPMRPPFSEGLAPEFAQADSILNGCMMGGIPVLAGRPGFRWCRWCSWSGRAFLTPQTACAGRPFSRWRISGTAYFERGNLPSCSSIRCSSPLGTVGLCAGRLARLLAWMNGAHQHSVQAAVLRAVDHPAGHSRHPVHGLVDHVGRARRSDMINLMLQKTVRHRHRVLCQRLHHDGDDLRRRAALLRRWRSS